MEQEQAPGAPSEGGVVGFPDPAAPAVDIRAAFRDFATEFIKLLTTTGIYTEDHPASRALLKRPFELFRGLDVRQGEITFLSDQFGDSGGDISVEGVGDETLSLAHVLRSSMSEHFLAKLKTYLNRNHILNLSIKTDIPEEEFARFVAVMVSRHGDEATGWADDETRFDFTKVLVQREVVHVSVILWDDILGYERRLPWRVKVAFARLRKDLRNLPLFQRATGKELRAVKRMIVGDIIRPLMRPDFIKDLLVNADLVSMGEEDLATVDVEREIVDCLHLPLVSPVVWELVSELDRVKSRRAQARDDKERTANAEQVEERVRIVARMLAEQLVGRDDHETYPTIRQLFDRGLVKLADLPQQLKQRVLQEAWTNKFLEAPDRHTERFEGVRDAEGLRSFFESFSLVLPELIRRDRPAEALRVLDVIRRRAKDEPDFGSALHDQREQLFSTELLDVLKDAIPRTRKPARVDMMAALEFYREEVVPFLVSILEKADDAAVRRDSCDALIKLGRRAVPGLRTALGAHAYDWFLARNLLIVLGELADVSSAPDVQRFLTHPNAKVREEAVVATVRIRGSAAEPYLLERLGDAARQVRKRTIQMLSSVDSRHPRYLGELERILSQREKTEEEGTEDMQVAAVAALRALKDARLPSGRRVPDLLLLLLDVQGSRVVEWARRVLGQVGAATAVRVEACRVLGDVGGREVLRRLLRLRRGEGPVAAAASDAALAIERRLAATASAAGEGEDPTP